MGLKTLVFGVESNLLRPSRLRANLNAIRFGKRMEIYWRLRLRVEFPRELEAIHQSPMISAGIKL